MSVFWAARRSGLRIAKRCKVAICALFASGTEPALCSAETRGPGSRPETGQILKEPIVHALAHNHPEFAQQLAEQIMREFNERLSAFMGRAVERRQAAEFQRRYDEQRRIRAAA
jgi:hypothetical protein